MAGLLTCGIGGDTVVAAQNGGTVLGGAGNDILIANSTQGAANGASHTTLDGGTGVNAMYGGSGFTTFLAGDTSGGYNQIWGGVSKMNGVQGFTNNTLSFASSASGAYVDILSGHDAYVAAPGSSWTGSGTYEDSILNVPNVTGSQFGDLIQSDNGVDRITGGGGADQLYAGFGGTSQDTFIYTSYGDSNLNTGYDTIVGFKLGTDKVDLSAFHTDASHLALSTAGTSNTVYLEQTPGSFNPNTDLAMVVNTSATGGLHNADFIF
jgi:Ca2+-binding RTX toxin-like protein